MSTKYDEQLGNDVAANFCDYVKQASNDLDKRITALYSDNAAKLPPSISGDQKTKVLTVYTTYTKLVQSDIGEINKVECAYIRERKDRIAHMTDFATVKEKLKKMNTVISETCENWEKIFAATMKAHTDYLPEIYKNPRDQRFGVVDFDLKGLDASYAKLAACGKSSMEKFSDGWKQVVQQAKAKTKEVNDKIAAEAKAAKDRLNAIPNLSKEKKTVCSDEIEKTVTDSKKLLDYENESVVLGSKDSTKEVAEDLKNNPNMYDPSTLIGPRRLYTLAAVNERAIAANALHILYTNCKDVPK